MPALKNRKHEIFAQEMAKPGGETKAALEKAGYAPQPAQGTRLSKNAKISARIAELQERGASRVEASIERILREQLRIGYSNVTDALKFTGKSVTLKNSDELSEDVTAAISEVQQTKNGVRIKFHNKQPALEALMRYKGMFKENIDLKVELTLVDLINASYPAPAKVIEHDPDETKED